VCGAVAAAAEWGRLQQQLRLSRTALESDLLGAGVVRARPPQRLPFNGAKI